MADSRKIVRVFLASPGDLSEERQAAHTVVSDFNALFAEEFGYHVELVGWEDTVSVFARPQAVINKELDRCELFVGLMWKKWGTPPDTAGRYSSGFEEEFERSVKRRQRTGKPEISLFFKDIDPAFLVDQGPDLKKVLAFRERLVAEKKILFGRFTDTRDFERKLLRRISSYVLELRAKAADAASAVNQTPTSGGEKQQGAEAPKTPKETPFGAEGSAFLREFVDKAQSDGADSIQRTEVARFRLLATIIGRQGNDDRQLGVHDANLLFSEGQRFSLGYSELAGLVSTGLRNYESENVPLWRWLDQIDGLSRGLLTFYSIAGSDKNRRVGALRAMEHLGEPLPGERNNFVGRWLADNSPADVKVGALRYLAEWGLPSDIEAVRAEFDRNNNETQHAATEALIQISVRQSRAQAVKLLYELQTVSVGSSVVETLFGDGKSLTTELLLEGVRHPSSEVRSTVARLLRTRRALPTHIAEQLLKDDDVHVRYEGLLALLESGRVISDTDARGILMSPRKSGMLSGLFALGGTGFDRVGENLLERFSEKRLALLKDNELRDAMSADSIFDKAAEFTLAERHFSTQGETLRTRLRDLFRRAFADDLAAMAQRIGSTDGETVEKAKSLEDFVRRQMTRRALDVLSGRLDPQDLDLIRQTLRSGLVEYYSEPTLDYLQTFGEWEDIPLILDVAESRDNARSLTLLDSGSERTRYRRAAKALLHIGKGRLPELLQLPMPSGILAVLVANMATKAFASLDQQVILGLLFSDAETVRKAASLKCVRCLAKKGVATLLDLYLSDGRPHYYNVIHWLDFGVSVPHDQASPAADRMLSKLWPVRQI